jgi:fluoride ion exporter CrcB/FEX
VSRPSDYPAIAAAAAVGAASRLAVAEVFEMTWMSTATVNLVACLAAGLALRWYAGSERLRRIITAGLLGGLSTFATLSEDLRELAASGEARPVILAFVAAAVGCPSVFLLARGRPRG